ncbi:MAG: peptide ABC transporter permease, partial [Alphaproteobacteria bacterium]|nr:peptide ABC transporter permease [Alphaproteobacteria bacterium]
MAARRISHLYLPGAIVGGIIAVALAAPLLHLADPVKMDVPARLALPSLAHPLGQDEYGRDVVSRIIWGARASLAVSFLSALFAGVIGTVLGLTGGYFRGFV